MGDDEGVLPTRMGESRNVKDFEKDTCSRTFDTNPLEKSQSGEFLFNAFNQKSTPMNALSSNTPYSLRTTSPQCKCSRVVFKKTPPIGDRCRRFNHWYNKCCQSAILRRPGLYFHLVKILEQKITIDKVEMCVADVVLGKTTMNAIALDVRRTYPSLLYFSGYGRRVLRRILMAYAFFDPQVGYVQGLNFIVAHVLWHSLEEQAFWVHVSSSLVFTKSLNQQGLLGVFKRCQVLENCMASHVPALYSHIKKVGVLVPMIASDWFMTLCANSIPIGPLVRL
ncbi:bifunctional Rab-GTPase-TBC domain/Rab-GTPase-TBC domain superfamily [Babesia duncani]|uniref:Bifunctional Rab-GTPase-TBC domain/Rab-GTPase-TBC domain superfamily n=1 Tax=Babesia duncani TaxID=323732 RepID=A0AAD9PIE7_9APIC|nr:bifunctional Rab-GTPase-TBC domain/Rab-GTPase-TBC domain superfamily [Babesia duncani]